MPRKLWSVRFDPLSHIISSSRGGAFWLARQWNQGEEVCRKALEFEPNFAPLRWVLAHILEGEGLYAQAIGERQRCVELSGGAPFFVAELGGTCAAAGRTSDARQILQQLHKFSNQRYVSAYAFALIHTGMKEIDQAFECLEKAYRERSAVLAWVKTDPRLDNLRSDDRFTDLLRRMKLPP